MATPWHSSCVDVELGLAVESTADALYYSLSELLAHWAGDSPAAALGYTFSQDLLSTRIKDAGIAIRHSRGRILFYTAGSGDGLEGEDTVCPGTQKTS